MVLCFGFVLFDLDSSFFYCYGHYVKHGKPSVLSREEGNTCWKTLRFACRALGELLQLTHPCPALPSLMSQIGSTFFTETGFSVSFRRLSYLTLQEAMSSPSPLLSYSYVP